MNAIDDPVRFATTSPHQAPCKPIPNVIEKTQAKGSVNTALLKMVTIRAFIPLPVP